MRTRLVELFLALPSIGKADVLAGLAHRETVRVREAYLQRGGPIAEQLLQLSNEYVHRLVGHTVAVLREQTNPDGDASLIGTVIEVSAERGQGELEHLAARLRDAQKIHRNHDAGRRGY